jgi:hypothetical protein
LSDQFRLENFRALYGQDATILFLIDENKQLKINTTDGRSEPRPGHTLIALVPPASSNEVNGKTSQA